MISTILNQWSTPSSKSTYPPVPIPTLSESQYTSDSIILQQPQTSPYINNLTYYLHASAATLAYTLILKSTRNTKDSKQEKNDKWSIQWHPVHTLMALSHGGAIAFYNLDEWLLHKTIQHTEDAQIHAMEWSPTGAWLAAAGTNGVRVWKSNALGSIFATYEDTCIDTLAWSADERSLALGSVEIGTVVVWNLDTDTKQSLGWSARYGITILEWSPNGMYLFAATTSRDWYLWETKTWKSSTWKSTTGECVAAAWAPHSGCLLLAFKGQQAFFPLVVHTEMPSLDASFGDPIVVDPTEDDNGITDGNIKEITWDTSGERVAVSVTHASGISVFAVSITSHYSFTLREILHGPENAQAPASIAFSQTFNEGALLSACWSGEDTTPTLSFHPMYFDPIGQ